MNQNSLEALTFLIEYPKSVKVKDNCGLLLLHQACLENYSLEKVTLLIDSYPKSVKVTDDHGSLPLHYVLNFIIEYYDEITDDDNDIFPHPPLEVWNFLIKSYPERIDQKDEDGRTPLDLLKETTYAMDTDNNGMLLLHHACIKDYYLFLIYFLIQAYPESSTVQDSNGKTPLQYLNKTASLIDEKGSLLLCQIYFLIQAYPESSTVLDHDRITPLQYLKERASVVDKRGMLLFQRKAAHFKGLNVEILPILFHANPEAI